MSTTTITILDSNGISQSMQVELIGGANIPWHILSDGTHAVTVSNKVGSNALAVEVVDASGNQITNFGVNLSIGSNTSPIPTSSTLIGIEDGSGNLQAASSSNPVPVSGTIVATGTIAVTQSGAWTIELTDGTNIIGTSAHPLRIDPTGSTTQPVSGTVSISGTVPISAASLPLPTGASTEATLAAAKTDLDTIAAALTNPLPVSLASVPLPTGASTSALQTTGNTALAAIEAALTNPLPVSGTVAISGTVPVSATALPLPTGASTAAKQPALGTAGSASADVISVQGVASMTPIKTDGSGVTQPVSGTVTANAGTNLNTSTLALETGGNLAASKADLDILAGAVTASKVQATIATALPAGTNVIGHVIVDTAPTTAITAASLPLPTGASTSAKQPALGTAGTASADVITVQGIASMTALKVDGSAVTQPVSIATAPVLVAGTALIGKVGIDQTTPGTTNGVQDASDGPVTAGTAAGKSGLVALVAATSAPTPTAGQQIALQGDTSGNLRTSPFGATGSFHTASNTGTGAALPSFTVPAGVKWNLKCIVVAITLSTAATRQVLLTVSNSGGAAISSNLTPITGAVNGNIYACTFAPGMFQSTSYVVLFTSGFATIPFPELLLPSGSILALFVNGGVAADAVQLNINYLQVPD